MARKKPDFLPGRKNIRPNCFAFFIGKDGSPSCRALTDVYCLKERAPCPFRATPREALAARQKSSRRLAAAGRI